MTNDRQPSDQQTCALNTIGQFIDINNIMPWLDVCFLCHQLTTSFQRDFFISADEGFSHDTSVSTRGWSTALQ